MSIKTFYKPNKYKVLLFLFLFGMIFFIPYLEATPAPGTEQLVTAGHYPLIFIFLISLAVIIEIFTGQLNISDVLLFFSFLLTFCLLYSLSCLVVYLSGRLKSPALPAPADENPSLGNGYVVDLDKNNKKY